FRAGGSGSVRGYAYQSLGIKEGNATVGGRYLGILSAEATHWLDESWGIAAFIDAGDAFDDLKTVKAAIGYGLGARWRSPAGPIGVDLAYGQRTSELQLHFSLAIPF
ncbi:MAG: BamA/TamA family outer membrane protein, partial [Azonexus sp.]|nr:BamA/TamA family outer membrane protein [Azonexus sp.]